MSSWSDGSKSNGDSSLLLGALFTLLSLAAGAFYSKIRQFWSRSVRYRRDNGMDDPPEELICPISLGVMKFPVLLSATGQVYDYRSLRRWLTRGNMLCPRTNIPLSDIQVVQLAALRQRCQEWLEKEGHDPEIEPSPAELGLEELDADLPEWVATLKSSGSLERRGNAAARINDLMVHWASRRNEAAATEHEERLMRQLRECIIDDLLWLLRYGKNYGKGCAANALSCFTLPAELAWIAACGAIPLVAMLQLPDAYAKQAAARVINNIVHGSAYVREVVGQAGGVQGLLWLVSSAGRTSYSCAPAAQALWGLASSARWKTVIISGGGTEMLKALIERGSRFEQRDAAGALLQLGIPDEALRPLSRRHLLRLRHCSPGWLQGLPGARLSSEGDDGGEGQEPAEQQG